MLNLLNTFNRFNVFKIYVIKTTARFSQIKRDHMLAFFIVKLRFNFNKEFNIRRLKRNEDDRLTDFIN